MSLLQPSRERRLPGDIFTFNMPAVGWLFGRIIRTDANVMYSPTSILVYVYRHVASDPGAVPQLKKEDLLLPPLTLNTKPWVLGYFRRVRREQLQPADTWPRHCFYNSTVDKYYNEHFQEVQRTEPCGEQGLGNHLTFDDDVSRALGVPCAAGEPAKEDSDGPDDWVVLRIPMAIDDADSSALVFDLEDALDRAVKVTNAGQLEGHGFDVRLGVVDIRLFGPDAEGLRRAVETELATWRDELPAGSWLSIRRRGGQEERIEY